MTDISKMKKDDLAAYAQQLQQQLEQQQQTEKVAVNTTLPRGLRDDLRTYAQDNGITLQAAIQRGAELLLAPSGDQ